jgi:hypothetical protein
VKFIAVFLMLSGLCYAQSGLTATLTWPALPDEEMVSFYNIYRANTSGAYTTPYANVIQMSGMIISFADKNLPFGTFFYIVRAVNIYGVEGPTSNEVVGRIPTALTPPIVTSTVKGQSVELFIDGQSVAQTTNSPLNYSLLIPRQTPPRDITKNIQIIFGMVVLP